MVLAAPPAPPSPPRPPLPMPPVDPPLPTAPPEPVPVGLVPPESDGGALVPPAPPEPLPALPPEPTAPVSRPAMPPAPPSVPERPPPPWEPPTWALGDGTGSQRRRQDPSAGGSALAVPRSAASAGTAGGAGPLAHTVQHEAAGHRDSNPDRAQSHSDQLLLPRQSVVPCARDREHVACSE